MGSEYGQWREELLQRSADLPLAPILALVRQTGSTNGIARRIARSYIEDYVDVPPTWLLAYEQQRGRGRGERSWVSPPGAGVWATRILRAQRPQDIALLPLLVPAVLGQTLDRLLESSCRVKWPNDLMVSGKKLGGVLIEALASEDGEPTVLVGFGINHGPRGRAPVEGATTCLNHCSQQQELSLAQLTLALCSDLDAALDHHWPHPEAEQVLDAYHRITMHRPGDSLRCRVGNEIVIGTFEGFDEAGRLCLATHSGQRRLAAGEIIEEIDLSSS
ncbi:MAG: biotin--[acetyl-CoA-carboxylase] ligase [Acidobacteriota bacterium]